jgi:peptidoglycan-associated lipoprotein
MRKNSWLVIMLVLIIPAMLFTVSCAKKAVETAPAETAQPVVTQPETGTAADQEAAERARLEQERIAAEQAKRQAAMVFSEEDVYFEFDSSALRPDAQDTLVQKAAYLRANPNVSVTVEGHCDERGTEAYNMALGERRAQSAKDFLVNLGIASNRLSIISYGEERPIDPGQNEAAWAKNRRAHFAID